MRAVFKEPGALGDRLTLSNENVAYLASALALAPAPSFTALPSINPDSGLVGATFTATEGTVSAGSIVSRRWLLGGIAIGTGTTIVPVIAGTLVLENTAAGVGGTTVASSGAVTVAAGGGTGPTTRLAFSTPLAKGAQVPNGTTVLNRQAGSTFTTTIPGITIDNASGTISGTPTGRSGLITETLNGVSHNSLMFLPETGGRTMKVGINSAVFTYYIKNLIFLDYMKGAEGGGSSVNQYGLPTVGSQAGYYIPMDDGSVTPIPYRIITDGDMDISVTGSSGGPQGQYGRPPMTKTSDGYTFTWYGDATGSTNNQLSIPTVRTEATYMALVREDEVAAWRAWKAGTRSHRFKDSWIAEVGRFSRFRNLDWSATNDPSVIILAPEHLTYTNRPGGANYVPADVLVEMCIAAGINLWFCLHSTTTDAQFQAMWPAFDRLLAAGHKVIIEWSNEVWNFGFPQFQYANAQFGTVQGATIDNSQVTWAWYNGYRSAQLAKLARDRGYQFVGGVQAVTQSIGTYFEQGLNFAGGAWSDFYGWTCSGYIGGNWGNKQSDLSAQAYNDQLAIVAANDIDAGLNNVMNYIGDHSLSSPASAASYWPEAKAFANGRGLKLVGYEMNGVSVTTGNKNLPASYDAFVTAMAYSPLSRRAAVDVLLAMQDAGFDEVMEYDFGSGETLTNSAVGIWGLFGHPAYEGVKDFLARTFTGTGTGTGPAVRRRDRPASDSSRSLLASRPAPASNVDPYWGSGSDG